MSNDPMGSEQREQVRQIIAAFNGLYFETTEACAKAMNNAMTKRAEFDAALEALSKNPTDPALEGKATVACHNFREALAVQVKAAEGMAVGTSLLFDVIPE